MKPSAVAQLVADTLSSLSVDDPLFEGADLPVSIGPRRAHTSRRNVEILPQVPERLPNSLDRCSYRMEIEVRYFFPSAGTSKAYLSGLDDGLSLHNTLEELSSNSEIDAVQVDGGRITEIGENELEVFLLATVDFQN